MPKVNRKKPKHIVARSILLQDAKGQNRIFMDAGNGDGLVCICLYGQNGRSIQICTEPDGRLGISVLGEGATVSANLGMEADESAVLSLTDREGRLGTVLGSGFPKGEHRLALFRDGQPYWSAPSRKSRKKQ